LEELFGAAGIMINYLSLLDKQRLIQVLTDLVRIPSVNPGFPGGQGEAEIAAYVKGFFETLEIPYTSHSVEPGRENIIGILPGAGDRNLLLEAHMDTVQVQGMTIPPFGGIYENGRIYGRGACDTKASLAAMLVAMETLKLLGVTPPCNIHLASVVDEEISYKGIAAIAQQITSGHLIYTGAIVGEPTQLKMIVAHKGCVRFHIDVHGVSCHSSEPALGINAIENMYEVIAFLKKKAAVEAVTKIHPLVGSSSYCISMIQGGVAPNTVPDSCRITVDRRTIPGEEPLEVWSNIKDELGSLQDAPSHLRLTVSEPFIIDYAMEVHQEESIVVQLNGSLRKYANEPGMKPIGAPYGSDASKLTRVGIPTVVFGPGNLQQAHTHNEWVDVEEVAIASAIFMDVMMNY
jgi:acetylornithine deacetylase/succinyl-diaminopimelate desuccinylase family protein